MKRRHLALVAVCLGAAAYGVDPLTAESRAQFALESALSRLLPPEQFLVQVDATVGSRTERRPLETELVEGESAPGASPVAPVPLPGFVGEPETAVENRKASPERRVYRFQETPVLEALRVHIALDQEVSRDTESVLRQLVDAQLAAYRGKASVQYSRVPMRKSERAPATAPALPPMSGVDRWETWLAPLFGAGIVLLLVTVLLLWRLVTLARRRPTADLARARRPAIGENGNVDLAKLKPLTPVGGKIEQGSDAVLANALRRRLLDRFLGRAEAFRLYYLRLAEGERADVCGLMRGPAFEALLESLELPLTLGGSELDPKEQLERLRHHEKNFEDFVAEETWQTGRLFGFLHQLTDDQLLSLANRESALSTCLLLRFLKPQTAAQILASMETDRRREVLAEAGRVSATSFEKIAEIEQRLRESVESTPARIFGAREKDVAFWGEVVSRTEDSKTLLEDIRAARPDLFPSLKRFRVKLEDLSSFPEDVVQRVLGDADNEILALALMTVTKPVVEDVLRRLSPRRSELVRTQMRAFADVSTDRARAANQALTTRLREAMG